MYRLTDRRLEQARDILERHRHQLRQSRHINVNILERELRDTWNVGYQELRDVQIDMLKKTPEYTHIAAYYMEHSNGMGVVSEFQEPLAKLFGLEWYYADDRETKRAEFWERAFAVNSEFDLKRELNGATIIDVASELSQRLIEYFAQNPERLYNLSSRNFEELIAELFDKFGYDVQLTKSTRDGGRDVVATGNTSIAESKYLIECKRYAKENKVDVVPIRVLHGVVTDERATKGILVTTSRFTTPAKQFIKRNKWTLSGRDFDGLLDWLKDYQRIVHGQSIDA